MSTQQSAPSSAPKFCSQCAAPLRAGSAFCTTCGASVLAGVAQPQPAVSRTSPAASRQPTITPAMSEQTGFNWGAVLCPGLWHWAHNMRVQAILVAVFILIVEVATYVSPWIILLPFSVLFPALSFQLYARTGILAALTMYTVPIVEGYVVLIVLFLPFGKRFNRWAWQRNRTASAKEFRQAQARWSRRAWLLPAVLVGTFVICYTLMLLTNGKR